MEPVSGAVGAAASVIEQSGLLPRLLGPLADELGADLVARHRRRNAEKVALKAARRVGKGMDQAGAVHPRVAYRVFEEGSYTDDDVVLEYLAGTLAAARTPDGRDDRASYFAHLVASLSSNQIRLHHAIYSALATAKLLPEESFGNGDILRRYTVFTAMMDVRQTLNGPGEDDVCSPNLVTEAVLGLYREGLLNDYSVGLPQAIGWDGHQVPVVMAVGSRIGLLLYLWAYGFRDGNVDNLVRCLENPFDPPGPTLGEFKLSPYRRPLEPSDFVVKRRPSEAEGSGSNSGGGRSGFEGGGGGGR